MIYGGNLNLDVWNVDDSNQSNMFLWIEHLPLIQINMFRVELDLIHHRTDTDNLLSEQT